MRIENVIFIIFALIAIIVLLWYIFGSFPTLEQVIIGLAVANIGFSFKINGDLQKHIGEHEGYRKDKKNIK